MRAFLGRTRVRLTATYSALFIVLAAAVSTAFYVAYARSQYSSTDTEVAERVAALVNGLETDAIPISFDHKDTIPDATQGQVSEPVTPALARSLLRLHPTLANPLIETTSDAGGRVRILAKPVDGPTYHFLVVGSHPMTQIQTALDQAKLLLLVVVVCMVAIASVLGYWLAGRALRPVRMIAGAARAISEHDLHRRIAIDLPPDELGELAETFNAMLVRLEAGFSTLQRFTADAAHELRAPLAMIRAELE
ncbi:MAG: HAMP domain-containing protein, partial [Chloroflexi bacterium]